MKLIFSHSVTCFLTILLFELTGQIAWSAWLILFPAIVVLIAGLLMLLVFAAISIWAEIKSKNSFEDGVEIGFCHPHEWKYELRNAPAPGIPSQEEGGRCDQS